MGASVRIEDEAFSDERYDDLAEIAGLADADHARGKMAKLWRQCTIEQTHILGNQMVLRVLGPRGVEALVSARLGEELEGGFVRIRGTKGRIEWLSKLRENGKKGGRPKKLRDDETKRKPSGFQNQNPPAPAPAPVPVPVPEREQSALALVRNQDPPPPEPKKPAAEPDRSRSAPHPNERINHDAWEYAAGVHARLKAEGVDRAAIGWSPLPSGGAMGDLVERTREVVASGADPAVVHRRRIDVAAAESRRAGHLKWFTPKRIYDRDSFWRAAELSPEQVRRDTRTQSEPTLVFDAGDPDLETA